MLSRWLIIGVDTVLGLLNHADLGDVANVSEVHAASYFRVEDGGSMYLRSVGNIAHIHTV
jgi:hypothetical protein